MKIHKIIRYSNNFLRMIPALTQHSVKVSVILPKYIWQAYIKIYISDILSDMFSDICSDILSDILSGIYSDMLSGIYSDTLCGFYLASVLTGIYSLILSGKCSDIHSLWHVFRSWRYGVRVQACPTASGAGDMVFRSRRAPQHPELAILCSEEKEEG